MNYSVSCVSIIIMPSLNYLETKIPPPILTVIFAILMWLASSLSDNSLLGNELRVAMSVVCFVVGFSIAALGFMGCIRAKTTINPLEPKEATSLVCTGVYRYTRNPMYLGLLMCLLGWGVYLSSAYALALPFLFILTISRLQIIPEERALESIFRSKYIEYKSKVRRWV